MSFQDTKNLHSQLLHLIRHDSPEDSKSFPVDIRNDISIDLRMGKIYLPYKNEDSIGFFKKLFQKPQVISTATSKISSQQESAELESKFEMEVVLAQGETAVIKTLEIVNLPLGMVGITFPVARQAIKGMLMINPGFIDPGYCGHLHVTVINMGREPLVLRKGDRFLRSIYSFTESAQNITSKFANFQTAGAESEVSTSPIDGSLLERLSRDFLSISERAEEKARQEVKRSENWLKVLPVVGTLAAAVIGAVAAMIASGLSGTTKEIDTLKQQVSKLEGGENSARQAYSQERLAEKLENLQKQIDALPKQKKVEKR